MSVKSKTAQLFKDQAFLFAIFALAMILGISLWDWHQFKIANRDVQTTETALRNLETLFSTLKDAETGQRGFLLTGDENFLAPHTRAILDVPSQTKDLQSFLSADPALQAEFVELDTNVKAKFAELEKTIALKRQGRTDEAIEVVKEGLGHRIMDRIRAICGHMQLQLTKQLEERSATAASQTRRARVLSTGASCLLFLLVAMATVKFRKEKEAAESANQAKSAFLANMSHELRTPLNAIIGYSEIVIEEAPEALAESIIPDIQKIRSSGKHLLELINAVLDLSKIEAGKMELYLETFGFKDLVEDIVGVLKPMAAQNQNTLTCSIEEGLLSMRADKTKVRQSLLNLVGNACKFTQNGAVSLNVRRIEGDKVAFSVSDTGVGMTAEQTSKLFEPFTQADTSTSRKFGGSGLGLTISRRFARMMGGDISVDSQLSKGSTFVLVLPINVVSPDKTEATLIKPGVSAESLSGTVLVIDDEPTVHELLSRAVSKHGLRVERALSGEEGMRLARKLHPQVITLDVMMPGMDGWTVLTALKSDRDLADIPVIMLTIVDNKNLGYALGASDYVTKPVDRERLVALLLRYRTNAGNTALIVEDDQASREMLARLLEGNGWTVVEADNGRSGLEKMAQAQPGIVLLDLMMPEMDGFEFLDQMRENKAWSAIPVIIITAKDLTEEDRKRLNGHVSRVLQKGLYKRDELVAEVSRLVAARIRGY